MNDPKTAYRVSGGPTPIHSALLEGTDHRSDGLTSPRARLKPGQKANAALDFDTASVSRDPDTVVRACYLPLPSALCRALLPGGVFPDIADSRHATPIKACISPDLGVSQPLRCFPNAALRQHLSGFGASTTHLRWDALSNSFSLKSSAG